jgi:hypothetical protein
VRVERQAERAVVERLRELVPGSAGDQQRAFSPRRLSGETVGVQQAGVRDVPTGVAGGRLRRAERVERGSVAAEVDGDDGARRVEAVPVSRSGQHDEAVADDRGGGVVEARRARLGDALDVELERNGTDDGDGLRAQQPGETAHRERQIRWRGNGRACVRAWRGHVLPGDRRRLACAATAPRAAPATLGAQPRRRERAASARSGRVTFQLSEPA